jgi:hypothetical protein
MNAVPMELHMNCWFRQPHATTPRNKDRFLGTPVKRVARAFSESEYQFCSGKPDGTGLSGESEGGKIPQGLKPKSILRLLRHD